jgi:hypothetical protein
MDMIDRVRIYSRMSTGNLIYHIGLISLRTILKQKNTVLESKQIIFSIELMKYEHVRKIDPNPVIYPFPVRAVVLGSISFPCLSSWSSDF